jgi:hypothetical protein
MSDQQPKGDEVVGTVADEAGDTPAEEPTSEQVMHAQEKSPAEGPETQEG